MKKFYLLICAVALGMTAQARQLTFYVGDQAVTPGTTVEFSDVTVEVDGGVKYVTMAPSITLGTDLYMKVNITADCTSGQTIQMCAGGACSTGKTVVKENIAISTGTQLPLKFEYEGEFDEDETVPNVTTAFTAVCPDYPETTIQFIMVMGTDLNSLTVVETPAEFNIVEGAIEYNVDEPTLLGLYTDNGTCVLSTTLNGCGSVSTAALQSGVYIYSFGAKSGKIYIK